MEQKRFDKKNLIVILALAALIALVAVAATVLKPEINPTLGELAADPTDVPAVTDVPADAGAEATAQPAQAYLVVTVAGAMYEPIPLYEEARYTITRGDMVNTIAVTPTSIKMHESSCDNQDCVLQGEVTLENRSNRVLQHMILCLPNEVILELYTREELAAMLLEMAGYTGEETNE
jgi:hypothetical protein